MPCSRCSHHTVCSVAVSSSDLSPVWATFRRPGKCALWSPLNLVCGYRTDYISAASFTQGQLWARQEACPAQPSPLLSLHPCPDLAGCPLSESSGSRMRKAALWVILKALLKRAAPPQTEAESSEESQPGHSKCPCSLAWAWVLPGVGHHPQGPPYHSPMSVEETPDRCRQQFYFLANISYTSLTSWWLWSQNKGFVVEDSQATKSVFW